MKKEILAIASIAAVLSAGLYMTFTTGSIAQHGRRVRHSSRAVEIKASQAFEIWKNRFQIKFSTPAEQDYRFRVFRENLIKIQRHNQEARQGKFSFTLGLNPYSHLTQKEFRVKYTGGRSRSYDELISKGFKKHIEDLSLEVPSSVNWVTRGAVTPVKNQGQCGSCYSFSVSGAVEAAYFLKKHSLKSFSESQIVDCAGAYLTFGCHGGEPAMAMEYVKKNGATTESLYPYVPKKENCYYRSSMMVTGVSEVYLVEPGQEHLLGAVVGRPISAAVWAGKSWQHYRGGIYNDYSDCKPLGLLNHAVLVVGYGSSNGEEYWLVKNSWGTAWGEKGYIRLIRTKTGPGICRISLVTAYPVV